jgi:hypothetical protein
MVFDHDEHLHKVAVTDYMAVGWTFFLPHYTVLLLASLTSKL